ncbi:Cyclin-dependent kinase inhibitor 1C like [Actinidia chinensis var. chinensis]|uniref:Cyclin-dependent kinase inhibitor 1C like n=1 Tax=Actinidia chinensis var. chinensis TaxID=1590841 RepID=A0A2R6RMR7_ACTCC|nr:Cyclin-dependent kinase inhibitor 1C like [Actinidia chinensis var. chinensis]
MNGRTYVLILFFWAVLTIVTPMLVRLSASAKPSINFNGEKTERTKAVLRRLLPPRALVATAPTQAPALPLAPSPSPSPSPSPHNGTMKRQVVTTFVQEQ